MARVGEDELIARHFAPLAGPGGLGLLDDAALLQPKPGHDLVLTVDAIVAGVHFLPDDPPQSVARKALGVNLSDLAAKGAEPLGFLLTLALPGDWTEAWLEAFCAGLSACAGEARIALLGGDTVGIPGPLAISVTAIGEVPTGRMVHRTGAAPGHTICVTGTIGDAWLGLALATGLPAWGEAMTQEHRRFLLDRYRHPRPRNVLAPALRAHASAAMDVSDGFSGDLAKMLRVSGVAGTVDVERVPLSPAAKAVVAVEPSLREGLLSGGDDYEILACIPLRELDGFLAAAAACGVPAIPVGSTSAGSGLRLREGGVALDLSPGSFRHFGGRDG